MELDITVLGDGPQRVVFVHGVLDRGRSFDRVADLLLHECTMEWYDRRGYGASLEAEGVPVGVEGHMDDLLTVLDGRPAIVVGHSFGGVTVLGTAIRAPELVQAVVLYETGMAWIPGWDDRFLKDVLWGEDPEGDSVRMMLRERYDTMTDEQQAAWLRNARAFVEEERSVRLGTAPFDLRELQAPLIWGTSESYPFAAVSEHLQEVVGEVEIVFLHGAGHNAHRTDPEGFADLVRRGIARAAARRRA